MIKKLEQRKLIKSKYITQLESIFLFIKEYSFSSKKAFARNFIEYLHFGNFPEEHLLKK